MSTQQQTAPIPALRWIATIGGLRDGVQYALTYDETRDDYLASPQAHVAWSTVCGLEEAGFVSIDLYPEIHEGVVKVTPEGEHALAVDDVIHAVDQALSQFLSLDLPELLAAVEAHFQQED